MSITLRNIKNSALTYSELDDNFIYLDSFTPINYSGSYTGSFSGSVQVIDTPVMPYVSSSLNFANDASASLGGVPLGGLYHTNGTLKIRIA